MASSWKVVVNWLLPPPLILTILLMLPVPQVCGHDLCLLDVHDIDLGCISGRVGDEGRGICFRVSFERCCACTNHMG